MDSNKVDVNSLLDDDSDDGSDSDATTTSSSHERLTREEKLYVLRHTRRQDPQGEEQRHHDRQQGPPFCCGTGSVSRLDGSATAANPAATDSSASSCRTLIIHGSLSDESWARITATGSIPDFGSQHYLTSTPTSKAPKPSGDLVDDDFLLGSAERRRRRNHHPTPSPPAAAAAAGFTTRSLPRSAKDFSSLTYRPSSGSTSLYQHDEQENSSAVTDECCERRKQMKILQNLARDMNWSLPLKTECYPVDQTEEMTACSALSISDTLLVNNDRHQLPSTVIVHDQSLTRDFSYLTKPPPAYPRSANKLPVSNNESRNSSSALNASRRTKVRRALSRSHPDLSKLGKDLGWKPSLNVTAPPAGFRKVEMDNAEEVEPRKKEVLPIKTKDEHQQQPTAIGTEAGKTGDKNSPDAVWSTPELVDAILEENFKLRQQVAQHAENIAKLAKFERELSAVTTAHQSLVKSSERKENLEKAARVRLEAEWRRSQEMNAALRNQIELLTSQLALKSASVSSMDPSSADVANQIARRDALIAQLVSQNKELLAHKERQDIELSAQKTTLHQQRSHIEILESALGRAQQHVNRLEDEFRRQCNDARHLLNGGGTAASESNDLSANREMANMEIRIRDLEARLSEKEMLIHLLQRASMDRELGYSATRPLTETVLSRHPSSVTSHHSSQMHQQDINNSNLSPSSSKNVRAASVGAPIRISKTTQQESQTSQPTEAAQHQSLDNQLRALDQFYQNKQSLIKALQTDKELFPNNYWAS